jgi:cell division protease FtsH
MVTRYGMVPELGHVTYDNERAGFLASPAFGGAQQLYSDDTAREIDAAVREIVARCYERAQHALERNQAVLEDGAKLLLAKETLDANELAPLFGRLVSAASRYA